MASQPTLSASTQDRKARLAQLRSLKKKQDGEPTEDSSDALPDRTPLKRKTSTDLDSTTSYLSGRNYDVATRGARLGFEHAPDAGQETVEQNAALLEAEVAATRIADDVDDKPLDLFKLQPKKPNWDLRRDLDRKIAPLNTRTDNAIARLVRARIAAQKEKEAQGDGVGMEGAELVEAMREREREVRRDELEGDEDD